MEEFKPASLVMSVAGRDKGKMFIIIGRIDENYVYISDGRMRRAEKPKKKKIKHLRIIETEIEFIAKRIEENGRVTNSELRKTIGNYIEASS